MSYLTYQPPPPAKAPSVAVTQLPPTPAAAYPSPPMPNPAPMLEAADFGHEIEYVAKSRAGSGSGSGSESGPDSKIGLPGAQQQRQQRQQRQRQQQQQGVGPHLPQTTKRTRVLLSCAPCRISKLKCELLVHNPVVPRSCQAARRANVTRPSLAYTVAYIAYSHARRPSAALRAMSQEGPHRRLRLRAQAPEAGAGAAEHDFPPKAA